MTHPKLTRRELLKRAGAATLASYGLSGIRPDRVLADDVGSEKHNVIWIVMDTARADRCSFQGYHRTTTPYLDRFAEYGTTYTNTISAAPWTFPSHASMFTGTYPSVHNAHHAHRRLDPLPRTLAEILAEVGYETVNITCNGNVTKRNGVGRGFQIEDHIKFMQLKDGDKGAVEGSRKIRNWVTDRADPKQPFFLFANFIEPHLPHIDLADNHLGRYLDPGVDLAAAVRDVKKRKLEDAFIFAASGHKTASEGDLAIMNAFYDANMTYLDKKIDELLAFLDGQGVLDDSIVIITGDHGENLGDHGMRDHQWCVYETLLHVPLIIRYPDQAKKHVVIDDLVQTVDIMPTIADVLSLNWPGKEYVQGGSLLTDETRDYAIAEYWPMKRERLDKITEHGGDAAKFDRILKAYRTEQYKFVWANDDTHELYDLHADPTEETNIIASEPEVAKDLHQKLDAWLAANPKIENADAAPPLDLSDLTEEERLEMEALGYM